ncbi:MAG: hypothetical protein WA945_00915, partial [Arcobacteraceae bacterium]
MDDFEELVWLDIPENKIIQESLEVLQKLDMIDERFQITNFGKDAISLGLHPRFAYMILKANDLDFAYEACLLASLLEGKDISTGTFRNSDILSRFTHLFENDLDNSFINKYRAKEVLTQANFYYKKLNSIKKVKQKNFKLNQDMIGVLLLFAYPDRLAKRRFLHDNRYILSNGKGAILN